jgi:UDPglucose--hexose-1-phosphate uridylyltransferase
MNVRRKKNRVLKDNLGDTEVLISPGRDLRPKESEKESTCPFCPGNEHLTPPSLLELPEGSKDKSWEIRVFENRYPFFPQQRADETNGIHEVIVESPNHDALFHRMPVKNISRVMYVIRQRMHYHSSNERLRALMAFRNEGLHGGASIKHPHTQLVGLSWVPPRLVQESEAFLNMAEQGYCPLCLEPSDPLIIIEEGSFRAFSPPAPRFQRETWIAPVHHEPAFTNLKDHEIDDLAALFKKVLSAIAELSSDGKKDKTFEYNLLLHTEPLNDESGTFHTHIEILPRPEALAGFEIGSGMLVNPVPPEQAVSDLRKILFA